MDKVRSWGPSYGCKARAKAIDVRFAIANVDDEAIRQLGPRLRRMNELMGMGGLDED